MLLCSCCDHTIRCVAIVELRGLDARQQSGDHVCLVVIQF
jgi:hypothetical protein